MYGKTGHYVICFLERMVKLVIMQYVTGKNGKTGHYLILLERMVKLVIMQYIAGKNGKTGHYVICYWNEW